MTMRVTFDASVMGWGPGGIARYLRGVLPHLASEPGVELTALANSTRPVVGIPGVTEIDRRLRGGPLWRATILPGHLARHRPDVYWLPDVHPPLWCPRPYVVTVHDLAGLKIPGIKPRSELFARRTIFRRMVDRATKVVAISASTAADLEQMWGIAAEKITVVPLGIDERFHPLDEDGTAATREQVSRRWGIRQRYVLVVGTVEVRKGLDILGGLARELGSDAEVVIAGRLGFEGKAIVEQASRDGARYLGPVSEDELLTLYRGAHVLLLPSLYEGFGLSALEAMGCGTPVVASAGAGSVGQQYGPAAILVESRSPREWAAAVRAVSDHPEMVSAGLAVAAGYRWPEAASATAAVLRAAASTADRR